MILKTSLFSKGIILSDIKRFSWVSTLYAVVLFFLLPLTHILRINTLENTWIKDRIQDSLKFAYISSSSRFQTLLIIVVPVVLAVLLFRYMQKTNAAAMMHSLPYTRKTLYCSHTVAGLFLLTIPVVFTGLILMVLQAVTKLGEYYSFMDIMQWVSYSLLFSILFFSITVFVGMFTGSSIAQLAFTYILHILPAGIYVLFQFNMQHLLRGYSNSGLGIWSSFIENKLPILTLLNTSRITEHLSTGDFIGYIIAILLFFTAAYYVYRIRDIEVSGDIIAFTSIRPVFKYGVTVCSMLLGGVYFTSISGGGFSSTVFGYIFSSFLGYWIAEMIMEKSIKVWRAYKGYIVYTLIILLALIGLEMDVTGYIGRVPNAEDVEKVYLGSSVYGWTEVEKKGNTDIRLNGYFFETEENIDNIIALHQELIEPSNNIFGIYRYHYIIYSLKDDKHLIRQYPINEQQYASVLKPIYESLEYKEARFPIIEQTPDDIKWIEIIDYRTPKNSVIISDSEEVREVTALLQSEVQNVTFEELIVAQENFPHIIIMNKDENRVDYAIRSNFSSIIQWLKERNYYQEAILMLEDIEYVVLEASGLNASSKRVEIRDIEVIEELLNLDTDLSFAQRNSAWASFYMTNFAGRPYYYKQIYEGTPTSDALRYYLDQLNN